MVLWVIKKVEDECPRLLELNVLVHPHYLCLEMRVDSFPEPMKPFAAIYQCNSFASREKFIGSNH